MDRERKDVDPVTTRALADALDSFIFFDMDIVLEEPFLPSITTHSPCYSRRASGPSGTSSRPTLLFGNMP